jgi:isoquinoline 1-oxidoreductase alpha subunit
MIRVNGAEHSVDGDTPLLWVLRDVLGLTGTQLGCGMALCGARTVHLNEGPIGSCVTPVESIGGASITTMGILKRRAVALSVRAAYGSLL